MVATQILRESGQSPFFPPAQHLEEDLHATHDWCCSPKETHKIKANGKALVAKLVWSSLNEAIFCHIFDTPTI